MSSQVSIQHPEYEKMAGQWKKCRDVIAGREAVMAAGVLYLPALKDQNTKDYRAYQIRANFVNFSWKTIQALSGMLFRKAPEIAAAESVLPLLDDVTMDGKSLFILAQQCALEVLTSGRLGVLVDYPQQSVAGLTLAEADKLNLRPSIHLYKAESIVNWKMKRIGNKNKLTLVVLAEDVDISMNQFEHEKETHYRVLDLAVKPADPGDNTPPELAYCVREFRLNDKQEDEQIGTDLFPLMNNKTMDRIPFIFIGVDDMTSEMDEPPLIDLVDVNLAHYRMNADYAHGLHFTGLPTAVVSGYTPDNAGEKLYIGSTTAWVFPDPQAKAMFLEFTGQGLSAIETAIERLENQMAVLGARLLTSEKKAVETAQTAQIHRAGESSILAAIANTISIGLTQALQIFSEWAGVPDDEAIIELNDEFFPPEVTPQELAGWLASWQVGAPGFSDQGFFDLLKQRELIAADVTLEDEQERILSKPIPKPTYLAAGK